MIIPDANLLLYAASEESEFHAESKRWVEASFSSGETVGLPWQVIYAFVRIATNPRVMRVAFSMDRAVAIVNGWLARPSIRVLEPGDRHWPRLSQLLTDCRCSSGLVTDAVLAALAIENGATLYSADRGFNRFPGLRWVNPLDRTEA